MKRCEICNATMVRCDLCGAEWCLDHTRDPLRCPQCGAGGPRVSALPTDGHELTPDEAQKAYDEAPAVPLSPERIQEIVMYATANDEKEAWERLQRSKDQEAR